MNKLLRYIWFVFIVRPLVLIGLGLNVRNREKLRCSGPLIIVANHNSHLDTMVLVSLFPVSCLNNIRPVAAVDYFLKNKLLAWFALKIIRIIPLRRNIKKSEGNPLAECSSALQKGETLILFPEGSRGDPEQISDFKNGVAHLAQKHPECPVIPVFMHGLGKSLPKGELLLVPFFCDVAVGDALYWNESRKEFMAALQNQMQQLSEQIDSPEWE